MSATAEKHNALVWPAALVATTLIVGLVAIIVTGHNTDDLVRAVGALFSIAGTLVGTGAWLRATQAAKQTNGDLDDRINAGVQRGITLALQQANQAPAAATVPGRRRRQSPAGDPPTEQLSRPGT